MVRKGDWSMEGACTKQSGRLRTPFSRKLFDQLHLEKGCRGAAWAAGSKERRKKGNVETQNPRQENTSSEAKGPKVKHPASGTGSWLRIRSAEKKTAIWGSGSRHARVTGK